MSVLSGVIWAMENPAPGCSSRMKWIFVAIFKICRPYLGPVVLQTRMHARRQKDLDKAGSSVRKLFSLFGL